MLIPAAIPTISIEESCLETASLAVKGKHKITSNIYLFFLVQFRAGYRFNQERMRKENTFLFPMIVFSIYFMVRAML